MEIIKVLLGDPRHHTAGLHSTYVPVGIGYIATYLTAIIPAQNFELKIAVDPDETLNLIDDLVNSVDNSKPYLGGIQVAVMSTEIIFGFIQSHVTQSKVLFPYKPLMIKLNRNIKPRTPKYDR